MRICPFLYPSVERWDGWYFQRSLYWRVHLAKTKSQKVAIRGFSSSYELIIFGGFMGSPHTPQYVWYFPPRQPLGRLCLFYLCTDTARPIHPSRARYWHRQLPPLKNVIRPLQPRKLCLTSCAAAAAAESQWTSSITRLRLCPALGGAFAQPDTVKQRKEVCQAGYHLEAAKIGANCTLSCIGLMPEREICIYISIFISPKHN